MLVYAVLNLRDDPEPPTPPSGISGEPLKKIHKKEDFLNQRIKNKQQHNRVCVCVVKNKLNGGKLAASKQALGLGRFMGPRQNMMGLRGQDRTEGED